MTTPDHQTPSMPPLPKPSLWVGSDTTPLSRRGSGRVYRHSEDVPPSDGPIVGLYTAAEAQAVADERVREALEQAIRLCKAERDSHLAEAARNNGRQSDMAFGSVNTAERISEAIRSLADLKGKP